MKKIITVLLALISCLFFAVGCQDDSSSSAGGDNAPSYQLSYTSKAIKRFEYFTLFLDGADGEVEWSSSDESIVTVQNGKIFGVGKGHATVYAKIGGETYACVVSVQDAGKTPFVKIDLVHGTVVLTQSAEYTLRPYISYESESYDDGAFTFLSSDETKVLVDENGKLTAVAEGVATVTVYATWRGVEALIASVEVTVTTA